MITGELKSQVDKIWDAFATGGIVNALTVIEQFTYLLFIRRLDERQLLEEKKSSMVGIPIQNAIFSSTQKELRWSSFKNKDPQTMFDMFTKTMVDGMTVFDHMKQVGHSAGVFADFMKNANFIIATPIRTIVSSISIPLIMLLLKCSLKSFSKNQSWWLS